MPQTKTDDATKLAKMKTLWTKGDYPAALAMANKWPRLGPQKLDIQRAAQVAADSRNRGTYRDMGYDPQHLYTAGLLALAGRYKLQTPTDTDLPQLAK